MTGEGENIQQIGMTFILVMQSSQAFFAHFHLYLLIIS